MKHPARFSLAISRVVARFPSPLEQSRGVRVTRYQSRILAFLLLSAFLAGLACYGRMTQEARRRVEIAL